MSLKSVEPHSHLPILSEVVNSLTAFAQRTFIKRKARRLEREESIGEVSAHSLGPEEQDV